MRSASLAGWIQPRATSDTAATMICTSERRAAHVGVPAFRGDCGSSGYTNGCPSKKPSVWRQCFSSNESLWIHSARVPRLGSAMVERVTADHYFEALENIEFSEWVDVAVADTLPASGRTAGNSASLKCGIEVGLAIWVGTTGRVPSPMLVY